MKITTTKNHADGRSMHVFANGLRIALVVFVAPSAIPPRLYHDLSHGFSSLKAAREYCSANGLAWFKTAQC